MLAVNKKVYCNPRSIWNRIVNVKSVPYFWLRILFKKSLSWYSVILFYNLSFKNKNSSIAIPLLLHGAFGGMPGIIFRAL